MVRNNVHRDIAASLNKFGLLPEECIDVRVRMDVDGPTRISYEILIASPERMRAFGQAMADYTRAADEICSRIVVNGREHYVRLTTLTYHEARVLAEYVGTPTIVWSNTRLETSGTLTPGKSVAVADGLVINVANTSGA